MKGLDKDCVFCKKIKGGDYMASNERCVAFTPLNPVTDGHLLVIPKVHTSDFTENPQLSAETMAYASELANLYYGEDVNLITSKGKLATQSINHLHIHIVPRRKDDGLLLPWSKSQAVQEALHSAIKEIEGLPTDQLVHTLDEDGDMEIGIKKSDAIAILKRREENN